jgi:hypothetical protein
MAVPISAERILQRKEDAANRRRAALLAALFAIDQRLIEIQNAKTELSHPANGKSPKLSKNFGIKITKKDRVLSAVRSRRRSGMTRREIDEYIQRRGWNVPITSITSYLYLLREDGLVSFDGRVWRPIEDR